MSDLHEFNVFFSASCIKDNYPAREIVSQIRYQLCLLSASMLSGDAEIHTMDLTLDGKTTHFQGDLMTEVCMLAIREMSDADDISLHISYETWWHDVGSFDVCSALERYDDDVLHELFLSTHLKYSSFIVNDSNRFEGARLFKYGIFDGLFVRGERERHEVAQVPEGGLWDAIDTPLMIQEVACSEDAMASLIRLTNRLAAFKADLFCFPYSRYDENHCLNAIHDPLPEDASLTELSLDYCTFKGRDEMNTLIDILEEAYHWGQENSDDDHNLVLINCNFADISEAGPRQLTIEVNEDGSVGLFILD